MIKKILFFSLFFTSNAFNSVKIKPFYKKHKLHSINIDNDNPSFIAKQLMRQYSEYGTPQDFNDFMDMLKEKNVEGITFLTNNNQINSLISIDNLHEPYNYDVFNSHIVKISPSMINGLMDKFDKMNINYDLLDITQNNNPIFTFLNDGFQVILIYFVFSFILSNVIRLVIGKNELNNFSGLSNNLFNMNKNSFQEVSGEEVGVKFDSVAGCDEAKYELMEVVDFLKQPEKYEKAGAKIPKGILLEGPPGTGKTLLARAVAGEANVNYLYSSGSQFIEMFVGVGASRVRELFKRAKELAPCVIFLDEIDAIGRQRGAGFAGGNDEREQTLNEILTNMDGFVKNEGIIIIGATNRADILDNALTRPGRFDRKVMVGLPDIEGRREIINIHFRNKLVENATYFNDLAKLTSGFSGADIENLANEAAILSVRHNQTSISPEYIYRAFEKITIGLPSTTDNRPDKIIELVSAHEIGHALIAYLFSDMFDLQRVTINSNKNGAGGYTLFTPNNNYDMFPTKKFILANIIIALGGRAAEELLFKHIGNLSLQYTNERVFNNIDNLEITTGASNDLKQANSLARRFVSLFGMGNNIGLYDSGGNEMPFLGKNLGMNSDKLSEYSKEEIDKEIEQLVSWAYNKAKNIIEFNTKDFLLLTDQLIEKKNLDVTDFKKTTIKFY